MFHFLLAKEGTTLMLTVRHFIVIFSLCQLVLKKSYKGMFQRNRFAKKEGRTVDIEFHVPLGCIDWSGLEPKIRLD